MEDGKHRLSDAERLDWLRLFRTAGIGPRSFVELLERFGDAAAALDALPALPRDSRKPDRFRIPDRDIVQREFDAVMALGARMLCLCEGDYPPGLAAIADPPPVLTVLGDATLLERPAVAVVGARNASAHGRRFAEEIAEALGAAGYAVVSGLARGIDGAAHRGALATGTVAAIAGGIDVVYPPEHAALHAQIGADGLLVTEQPLGTTPTARHFPARNRLISGLSSGVLVVEAAVRSGSLITARMALEQGRDVFAVPGSPRDPRCGGTNDLLRQGAILTESAADIVEALRRQTPRPPRIRPAAAPSQPIETERENEPAGDRDRITELLAATPTGVDELVRECHMSAAAVQTVLLELELEGLIERHPGNRFSLVL